MAASSVPRTRSFGGCSTCRSRHMKCDEKRPQCSNCIANNLDCQGYIRNIFFDPTGDDDGPTRYRQLLFSDGERLAMNAEMTCVVPLKRTHHAIAAIDQACDSAIQDSKLEFETHRGPFGAFRLISTDLPRSPSPSLSAILRLSPLASPNFNFIDFPHSLVPEWMTPLPFDLDAPVLTPNFFANEPQMTIESNEMLDVDEGAGDWLTVSEPSSIPLSLDDAPLLLKHYADNVISSMTPHRHSKTPWHVLFLPNAKTTLAGLAMNEAVDDANLTIFYGIMAISALDLKNINPVARWAKDATVLECKAQTCLQSVLHQALSPRKIFKYKSAVMAVLVMIELSMINSSWEHTDHLFLEAERIIRLRGLSKSNKSRKVRLLHHCYAYMRVFHESLSLRSRRSANGHTIQKAIELNGIIVPHQDPPSFRLMPWGSLDKQILEVKTREQGENDLHLYTPGSWDATLYPEIFGIPETWLVLLSQVIRLGNEKELSETDGVVDAMPLKDYLRRAKDLETCILNWRGSDSKCTVMGSASAEQDFSLLDDLLSALRHALTIYFYRRIYDVDPHVLQPEVTRVLGFLLSSQQLPSSSKQYFKGLAWPAFIAGCEAITNDLQQSFIDWFENCTSTNSHTSLAKMKSTMEQVWSKRCSTGRPALSWVNVLSEDIDD